MIKKGVAVILSVAMLFLVSACGSINKINRGGFVVGILTGTAAQFPEQYYSALQLKEEYKGFVTMSQFADTNTLVAGTPSIVKQALELAESGKADAIVIAMGAKGSSAAVDAVKAQYPDMVIICLTPEEELQTIASKVDMVLVYNEPEAATRLAKQAKSQGAETFVNYSFKRHTENSFFKLRNDILEASCEAEGIDYIYVNAIDPTSFMGANGANQFIREDMSRQIKSYGKNTVFYSSDCTVQATLISEAIRHGAIISHTCYPSVLTGFPEAFELEIETLWNKPDTVIEKLQAASAQIDMSGRLSTWGIASGVVMLEAAVRYAFYEMNTDTGESIDEEELRACIDAAVGKNGTVALSKISDPGYPELSNCYGIMADYVVF